MKNKWRAIKLLNSAEESVLQAFDQRGWPVTYAEGEAVLWEGEQCEAVYFITKGMVEVFRTAVDGREHTLRVLHTGNSFNLVPALLEEGKNPANVRCMAKTELLVVKKEDLQTITTQYPSFALRLLKDLAERLARMAELAGELALHTVRQRTAAFLIREATNTSLKRGKSWTQDDMARQVGTVRDVIGRTLREFDERGLIERNRGDITLVDRDGLERVAKGMDTT